jgi:cysteine synthase B
MIMQQRLFEKLNNSVLAQVGNTPLIRLSSLEEGLPTGFSIWGKHEGLNPGGSVKDRPALQMIKDGIETGKLTSDKVILDSTSGNTGIALAMIGSVLGIPVELCVPENVSMERKARLAAYGAKVIFTSPMEGSDGAIIEAREIYEQNPEKYFKPDQYQNPSNPKAHYLTTGPEIYEQTNREITHFIASIGTSGTVMGTGKYLKEVNPEIEILAAEPDDPFHGLEGLKHMESSIVPGIYHPEQLDGKIPTPTEPAYEMARQLARDEGLFVGQSAGGAAWAARHKAQELAQNGVQSACLVTILCDSGDKYISKGLWEA